MRYQRITLNNLCRIVINVVLTTLINLIQLLINIKHLQYKIMKKIKEKSVVITTNKDRIKQLKELYKNRIKI